MATKFLEPGGDASFTNPAGNIAYTFWDRSTGSPVVSNDVVHGPHLMSNKYVVNSSSYAYTNVGILSDTGSRINFFIYIVALPSATSTMAILFQSDQTTIVARIRITSTGLIQLWDLNGQIGSDGATLSTGKWYRISWSYKITSTTVNSFNLFLDGNLTISITNATIANIGSSSFGIGNLSGNLTFDLRSSDHYIDDSSNLLDPGNIWSTAKRSFSNGTTNGFTTQIGSAGSGYGTGHSPQVNERPGSTSNGWSMVGIGNAVTEEYNIEGQTIGDINLLGSTIIDYMGWVCASSALSETGQIIVNNVTSNIFLTSTNTLFKSFANSVNYPSGTGTDIGIITSTAITTVSLYECGIIVAYIPNGFNISLI